MQHRRAAHTAPGQRVVHQLGSPRQPVQRLVVAVDVADDAEARHATLSVLVPFRTDAR
jgi:hypothetical protein